LLNLAADTLFIVASSALVVAALLLMQRLPLFPLHQLVITKPLTRVSPVQIEYAVRSSLHGSFFLVDLDSVRSGFEKLPWVRHADVRRLWPDKIEVFLEEQVTAARWRRADGEVRLVNTQGEVFSAANDPRGLPDFAGPEGSAALMLGRYREFEQKLAPLGLRPVTLALNSRNAWQIRLDDGMLLELGRDQNGSLDDSLIRFVAAYPQVHENLKANPDLVDLRYPNGFALRLSRSEGRRG
jgi:cell division protein FtsQ